MTNWQYDFIVYEYPEISHLEITKHGVIFTQAGRIMLANRDIHEVLVNLKTNDWFSVHEDNKDCLWCSDENQSVLYDLKTHQLTPQVEKQFRYGAAKFTDNLAVGKSRHGVGVSSLYCKHLDTNEVYENGKVSSYLLDKENIFTYRVSGGEYTCYDTCLNEIWHYSLNNEQCQPYFSPKYYLFDDSVIINGIVEDHDIGTGVVRRNYEVLALYKSNGQVKWRCILESPATRSYLAGDRVYIYRDDIIIVVDARVGDIMFEKPIGFTPLNITASDPTPEDVSVFSHNDHVFIFSMRRQAVRICDLDMKVIQEISYPKPDSEYCLGSFGGAPKIFATHGQDVYFVLGYSAGMDGLVCLNPTDKTPVVKVMPRPTFIHEKIPEEVGYAYKLSTDSADLDEVISGGEYAFKEIAQYLGSKIYTVENKHDVELNDRLIFSVKKSALPPDAEDDLKRMVERLETYFRNFRLTSGKTKKNFRVELEFR